MEKRFLTSNEVSQRTGIGRMEMAADIALFGTADERLLADRQNLIEARANSPEVSALNDRAELAIFGTIWGRVIDPETGKPVIDDRAPIVGKLAEISQKETLESHMAGHAVPKHSQAEKYKNEVLGLQNDGLELCQAFMVMSLREAEKIHKAKLIDHYINNGFSEATAVKKANLVYAKKDKKRLDLVKNGGAFTIQDYSLLAAGRDPYVAAEAPVAAKTKAPEAEAVKPIAVVEPEIVIAPATKTGRFKRAVTRMGVRFANRKEYFYDKEEGKRRRITLLLGAGAVAMAATYFSLKAGYGVDSD